MRVKIKQKDGAATLLPLILTLAWPTMLEQLLQTAVQYVDVAMVGRLGPQATAAVGATATINWLLGSSISALGVGFLAYIARECGARRFDRARQAASQVVLSALFVGALFTALALSLSRYIPRWMQVDEAIRGEAGRYFFILSVPLLPRAAIILFGTSLRATGDTKTPMLINIGMNAVNVALNFFLIFPTRQAAVAGLSLTIPGAGLGVTGAAVASAVAFAAGGGGMTLALWRHKAISPRGQRLRPDKDVLRPCLKVALPAALQRFGTSMGYVAFAAMINALGPISMAAHSIANTAESAFYIPGYGMMTAAATLSGNFYGAGDRARMKKLARALVGIELALMTVSGAVLYAFAGTMMRFFTRDAAVIALGARVLRMVALSEPVYGVAIVLEGMFMGVGDTMSPFVFNIAGMWGVRIAGTFICTALLGFGLPAAWGCMIAHNVLLFLLLAIHYLRGRWNPLNRAA